MLTTPIHHACIIPARTARSGRGVGEIWHGGALELSAFDRLAATARRPGGQKLCRSAIRRSERAGGGPPQARSAQCLQARRRWGAQSDIEKRDDRSETIRDDTVRNPIRDETIFLRSIFLKGARAAPWRTDGKGRRQGPRFIRCRCTPCTDTEVGAQRPHPLPRCVSECYTFSAPYTEVPSTCPHRHLGYSRDVHTGGARE